VVYIMLDNLSPKWWWFFIELGKLLPHQSFMKRPGSLKPRPPSLLLHSPGHAARTKSRCSPSLFHKNLLQYPSILSNTYLETPPLERRYTWIDLWTDWSKVDLPAKESILPFHDASLFLILSSNGLKAAQGSLHINYDTKVVDGVTCSFHTQQPFQPSTLSPVNVTSEDDMRFCHVDFLATHVPIFL